LPSTIEKVHREFKDQPLTVLAVNIQESPERVAAFVKSAGISVPVLLDRDGAVTAAYRVRATPTVVLIGRDGKLVAQGAGARPWDGNVGRALLRALVGAPAK
jgi:cytochrome c biogenesis protein CcmG, thiol:disulfide interchange protein DsbE